MKENDIESKKIQVGIYFVSVTDLEAIGKLRYFITHSLFPVFSTRTLVEFLVWQSDRDFPLR